MRNNLQRKRLSAAAGSLGVWIIEDKSFSVQSARKLQSGAHEVQERFFIHDNFDAVILENLVVF